MKRVPIAAAAILSVLAAPAVASAADKLDVYAGDVSRTQLSKLVQLGVDRHELELSAAPGGKVHVETILSGEQAAQVGLEPKRIDGQTATQRATLQASAGLSVFRTYSGPGGLKEEFVKVAQRNPRITKLVSIGKSLNGQDIIALKVSEDARRDRDGSKPSVLYMGAQHAREWITPEMVRRLMHHFVDGYDRSRKIRDLVDENELWFLPVANPDGYDYTFLPDNRMWRKNLRDNNGDGQITPGDGVDPNRNYAYKWGYDNEGSSQDFGSETFRGAGPNSEPESKALDSFVRRVGFTEMINYHSAAQLLLYGTGWQVSTPTPDDVLAEAMAGDDVHPAVPGYDPDISAELYTTNGEVDTHMTENYGVFAFTPEMSTCATASDSVPDDEWEAEDCGSVFMFPDDERLIQAEFEKNVPFALAVAESAADPDDPVSAVGRRAEDFRVDSFDVSYGDPQTVAVVAKRALKKVELNYRVNNGKTKTAGVDEWRGGERYGDENDHYYAELRGEIKGTRPGDRVKVWFTGEKKGRHGWDDVASSSFTYTVKSDTGSKVLVIANEDYTGVNPTYPAGTNAPKYAQQYLATVRAAGYSADLWDVDAQGVPHDLGVLDHYKAIVWYLGDNRITQDPEDELISTPFGELPDIGVAERQQYLTMAVRDFLNEGGKLLHVGETAQYSGLPGISDVVGGLYYGINGDPSGECVVTTQEGFFDECLILADDFRQYYLGAFARTDFVDPPSVTGIARPLEGYQALFGGPVTTGANPLDEAGTFQPTSEALPVGQFPQFASRGIAEYPVADSPFSPVEGTRYAGALHADASYQRLTRTIAVPATATSAQLRFQLSINTEPGYDHVIVEAHTSDSDWTTLPDLNGGSRTTPPTECTSTGFLLQMHPWLRHYIGGADCTAAGTTGSWNSFTGSTDGWDQVAVDLTPYKGRSVEISIAYVTDPNTGGIGAFVDDTRVVIDGATTADGFEGATSTWTPGGPPAGSAPNAGDWQIGEKLVNFFAGTSTDDTLLLGFGLEQLATQADRTSLVRRALGGLIH